MKLLILTQKIDTEDPVLGFLCGWIASFAQHFKEIRVICLEKGSFSLPGNVRVLSLGKERGYHRLSYILNFYRFIWRERKNYDTVFVHMNPEYVVLGGIIWRILGKKVALWYNHEKGGMIIRLAIFLANAILHTSPYAFPHFSKKARRMPAGIDTKVFKPAGEKRIPSSLLYLGRIAPIKHLEILIKALYELEKKNISFTLSIFGDYLPKDELYYRQLRELAKPFVNSGTVMFQGAIANYKTPPIYARHELSINLSPAGLFDKTVLESMASETPALVSSPAFADLLPPECRFEEGNPFDMATKIGAFFSLPEKEKRQLGKELRDTVEKKESLSVLTSAIDTLFKDLKKG